MTVIEDYIDNDLLPNLVRDTCCILNDLSNELMNLNWHKGESNTDMDFSEFAKNCFLKAFESTTVQHDLKIEIDIPDLILCFYNNEEKYKKKVELKSTKSQNASLPGSTIRKLDLNMWTIICHRNISSNRCTVYAI